MESYRQMMERQMIIGTVQRQEIMQKATLTDEEARQYYDAHQKDFMKPATVTLREMFVAVPTETRDGQDVFNVAADEAAKKKMDDAIARLKKGEDFAAVAAEMSDSGSKANGGADRHRQPRRDEPDASRHDREVEAGRNHRADAGEGRLSDLQSGCPVARRGRGVRQGPRQDLAEGLRRAARGRNAEIPHETAWHGPDRVEGRQPTRPSTRRVSPRARAK